MCFKVSEWIILENGMVLFNTLDQLEVGCGSEPRSSEVEQDFSNWFFVLFTLSSTVVGAQSSQLAQLCDLVPPSNDSRGLPGCWRVCKHGYNSTHFLTTVLHTSAQRGIQHTAYGHITPIDG